MSNEGTGGDGVCDCRASVKHVKLLDSFEFGGNFETCQIRGQVGAEPMATVSPVKTCQIRGQLGTWLTATVPWKNMSN